MSKSSPIRLPAQAIEQTLFAILQRRQFTDENARLLAKTFTDNSLDGVYTHGLNRFPRFIDLVDRGHVKVGERAECSGTFGGVEQWDGRLGAGILNAVQATERAMALAADNGIGCVGMANTNHWMRGGTYGWQAARANYIFIGWTNTIANMPAWGALDSRLGNNPLVLAVPYQDEAIVLDMAQSQFSYGAMESAQRQGRLLPVAGGYDESGQLTRDPAAVLQSQRALPVGYWKGSGLSLLLDILAVLLSGGRSTADISRQGEEFGVSQVFIAIDTAKLSSGNELNRIVSGIIDDYRQSQPVDPQGTLRYPGEGALARRVENQREGIPVDAGIWAEIQAL
ncbi:3-dehydro-L-gulonate 2-dehydrogenase [Marinimicrobium sp. C2-29]|uniref:3-dehydro-L-gulonate 2-dehydrogenase n=1 Tax=Marinimicrobium sp. C2-29 TaxID=3139825 RepID=UPI003138A596